MTLTCWQVHQSQEFLHPFLTEGAGDRKQRNLRVLGSPPCTTWKYWRLPKGLPFQEPRKSQKLWLQAANKADLAPLPLPLSRNAHPWPGSCQSQEVTLSFPQRPPSPTSSQQNSQADKGLLPSRPLKAARPSTPAREAQDPSQSSAKNLGRQMARRMGRQIEAPAPCQDDTQKYIPVITGCQWCVSTRCRVCFWTL